MMRRRSCRSGGVHHIPATAAIALGLGLLINGPAVGDQLPVDLGDLGTAGVRFDGATGSDYSGWSVAPAGDVNDDGYDDVLIGAILADTANGTNSGATYVVFGSDNPGPIDLASLGTAGFRVLGAAAEDRSGYSVAGVGDVNGDGRDDILIGAPQADVSGRADSGAAYLVFGKTDTGDVSLASLGPGGVRLAGATAGDWTGWSVAGVGDVNGDKTPDIAIGAQSASNNGRTASGSTYVVFGSDSAGGLDLATLGTRGYRIDGAAEYHRSGLSVAGPGDVNGDGTPDVLIGAGYADRAYLVFGKSGTGTVDLASLDTGGFAMSSAANDHSGWSVAGPGDVNDDGTPDLLIGAPLAGNNNRAASGSAYVVFGKSSTDPVSFGALGSGGIRIDGASADDQCGYAVSAAGDVDGDTVPDMLLGAPRASNNGRILSGSSYVIYGTDTPTGIDLATVGSAGFRIDGAANVDKSGSAVAGAGDVNGDGKPDMLVGAPETDNNTRSTSGSSYLVLKSPPVYTVPDAPTGVTGTPDNAEVHLSWTAPGSDGGAAITGYRIEVSTDGTTWATAIADTGTTATTAIITGLTNGTSYRFRVSAINPAGVGPASDPSAPVTPRTVPGAPTSPRGTPGDQQVQLSWTAPASDGGAPITGYRIMMSDSGSGGPWTTAIADTGSATTTATVTGLTNGTNYHFRIHAINPAGVGPPSGPLPVKPRTVADTPTGVSGTPGNQQVQLIWTAPSSDGGAAITGYRIEVSTDGTTWATAIADTADAATAATLTGLTNGTSYRFRVSAINQAGSGPASDPSAEIVPRTVPGAPTEVAGVPGDTHVQLTWTAPGSDGGAAITGYRIEVSTGGAWTVAIPDTASTTTTATVGGLTNGTGHRFRVSAHNVAGFGPASAPSGELAPRAPVTPPPPVTPAATLAVTARPAAKAVPKTGKATLVKRIAVGPGQTASITVKVQPKKAKKKVTVTETATAVKVRATKAPKGKVTVKITASGAGFTPTTWSRTWKVR